MRGLLPRTPMVLGRLFTAAAIGLWLLLGGEIHLPAAFASLGIVLASAVLIAVAERRRGRPYLVRDYPVPAVVADAVVAGLWMIGSALVPRSVAFVLFTIVGSMATFRLGGPGAALTIGVYLVSRIMTELIRIAGGVPSPPSQLVGDTVVIGLALAVLAAIVESYRGEQRRAGRSLARARVFEQAAIDVSAQTEPEGIFSTITARALDLVAADHASLIMHRGDGFMVVAGAGTGARVIGLRASARLGVVGEVVRSRGTVRVPDYQAVATAPAAVRALGLRTAVAVPIIAHGEIVAILLVARLALRAFDEDEHAALEGFTAHAATAITASRIVEQARRIEFASRGVAEATPVEILERVADEAAGLFNAEFVVSALLEEGLRVVRALGHAAPLAGQVGGELGPALRELVRGRELIVIADYVTAYGGQPSPGTIAAEAAIDASVHAVMVAPLVVKDRVAATLIVGTTDPHRSFDLIDRQGILALCEVGAAALRNAAVRADREARIQRLGALNELAAKTTLVHDPMAIALLAYQTVGALVAFDSFYIARYDAQRRLFDFLLEAEGAQVREGESFRPLGTGPTSQVVLTGEPYVARGTDDPVRARGRMYGDESRTSASAIHVPMKIHGETMGVLSAQSYRADAFDDEDVAILRSFGNLVASAFENAEHHARQRELYLASVRALAAAVDARDPHTRSHSARVAALAKIIAVEMQLPADEIRRVQLSALLHDIGKIGIPDAILNKPAALTPEEWVIMKTHPALSGSILAAVEPLAELVPIVRAHHERYDGTGYPDGLAGDAIPLGAYIVQAADAYEVIVSKRAYKAAQSIDHAVSELRRCTGSQFHPAVVTAFLRAIERDQREGSARLTNVGAMLHENIDDMPGPGPLVERIAASSQTHARQLAILQRLASEISAVLDIDDLAIRLLRIICDAVGHDNGFLLTVDPGGEMMIRAAVGASIEYVGQTLPRGAGISSWVIEHGRLQNVADVQGDTRYIGPADVRSALVVPLRIGDERVGVLGIESPRPGAFSAEDEALLTAVSHQVAAAVRVARLHQAAKTAAATDPLTGLPNRRVFFEHVAAGLRRAESHDEPLSVAIIDANRLKQLNDEFGHAVGDQALVRIGELLAAGVRGGDLVARIGGDEFAVVFPGAPLLAAERIMRRLAEEIGRASTPAGQALPTIAWGIAPAPPEATSVDALVDAADRAMYRQKQLGRQRAGGGAAS